MVNKYDQDLISFDSNLSESIVNEILTQIFKHLIFSKIIFVEFNDQKKNQKQWSLYVERVLI